MRLIKLQFVFFLLCALATVAFAQQNSAILPQTFAGWEKAPGAQKGSDPARIDQAHPNILKEYGLRDFETATYTRPDRTLKVKAARFQDATGAYGAFTFYREPKMNVERVGTMAASAKERVLFFRENLLIEAQFDRVTAMSASELRELAANLPAALGTAANLPTLPNYLPREQLVNNSAKYLTGPVALKVLNAPLGADLVDFSVNPEIMLATYSVDKQSANLILVAYPTPHIAGERLRTIEGMERSQDGTTIVAKRTGPLVAVVQGPISEGDAKSIIGRVNYEAEVTWNENTGLSKRDNIGNLVIAAFMLVGIILLISLGTGVLFGFIRVMLQKILPARYAARAEEAEFIRLNLEK